MTYEMDSLEKTVCITTLWEIDSAIRKGDTVTVLNLTEKVRAIATGEYF